MVGLNCLWTTGYEMELMVCSDQDDVTEIKWPRWSDWYEVISVWSVLVWSDWYEVTVFPFGMKWLKKMKWLLYEVTGNPWLWFTGFEIFCWISLLFADARNYFKTLGWASMGSRFLSIKEIGKKSSKNFKILHRRNTVGDSCKVTTCKDGVFLIVCSQLNNRIFSA